LSSINFQFFPRSQGANNTILEIVDCFINCQSQISSSLKELKSDEVLKVLKPHLEKLNFKVESGKTKAQKIHVPVLFGANNKIDKNFNADALSSDGKIVIEVEAGRALANNQFLKDIFQACMMFEVEYLVIAVRNQYKKSKDYLNIYAFLETMYISNRLKLPLKGILLIGY